MKKILFIIIICLISCSALAKGMIIVSGHPEYPPFMWKEGKKIIGVAPELVSIIFRELDVNVDSKYVGNWDEVQKNAELGKIDIIVGIFKTDERSKYLLFPDLHYFSEPIAVFVKKGKSFPFKTWADLNQKTGTTNIGESFGQKFDSFAKENLKIQYVNKIVDNYTLLVEDKVDYMIYGLYPGLVEATKAGFKEKIESLPKYVGFTVAYQGFSKKSEFIKHLPFFSNKVKELKKDGTIERLISKYMKYWEESMNSKTK